MGVICCGTPAGTVPPTPGGVPPGALGDALCCAIE
eukprot:CAMPEP_0115856568 /NCGR_PEP_ID=MMETSP0287-20121206/15123_1 /TAXON_ID=412157 /ORGANISM="Chrysochromulina rotalis, Strain UIO044" /LENGTH=34 /DNA_ID= /DNA_START= /DNA_END= /DNA_ORIENTATION=